MTDEVINKKFDVVADHLASLAIGQEKADARIARLERVLMLAIRAGGRERQDTREKFNTLAEAMSKMAESQTHTDRRLDALIDIIQEGRKGKGNGQ